MKRIAKRARRRFSKLLGRGLRGLYGNAKRVRKRNHRKYQRYYT